MTIRSLALTLTLVLLPSSTLAAGGQCIFLLTDLACLFGDRASCGVCPHPPSREVRESGGDGGGVAIGTSNGHSGTDGGDTDGGDTDGGDVGDGDGPPGDGPPGDGPPGGEN